MGIHDRLMARAVFFFREVTGRNDLEEKKQPISMTERGSLK